MTTLVLLAAGALAALGILFGLAMIAYGIAQAREIAEWS